MCVCVRARGIRVAKSCIAMGYVLNGPGSILDIARFFSFTQCQDRLGAHPTSYPMDTGGSLSGGKMAGD
jgi:hypothetical protein